MERRIGTDEFSIGLTDAGGGDCAAFVNLGDRVEVVGLSDSICLLQQTLTKDEAIRLLKVLSGWISKELDRLNFYGVSN